MKMKKLPVFALIGMLCLGSAAPVFAVDTELTNENGITRSETTVESFKNSKFTVGLPINVTLGPTTCTGTYTISVKGDIDSGHQLTVEPVDKYSRADGDSTDNYNFFLKNETEATAKEDVLVTITPEKTAFLFHEITPDTPVTSAVTIQAEKLLAGLWRGTIEYKVSLEERVVAGDLPPENQNPGTQVSAGLYGVSGELLCSWENSGIDVTQHYTMSNVREITTSPYYVISNSYPTTTKIVIPDTVTELGTYAFTNCNTVKTIEIPDTVTSVGEGVFFGCTALTSATIPEGITSLNANVFYNCYSLSEVRLPDSLTSMGSNMFANCIALTEIVIPNSVETISDYTFYTCRSLSAVQIPSNLKAISRHAFGNCEALTSVDIPSSVTYIGESAFEDCTGLTSVDVPSAVRTIGQDAFKNVPHINYSGSASGSPWGALGIN